MVAAGTIVTKDINENYVLVAGSPMRIVKSYSRIEESYEDINGNK